jgi:3-hydroxyisobutyrate dehydrogenase-like beta-hydroxyacid dehydrogenase
MNVGFVGLGRMGVGMAASLLKAQHEVTVCNRTPDKAAPRLASSSTLSVAVSRRLVDAHARARQQCVAAPLFGRPDVAAIGKLPAMDAGLLSA